jgi:hypothetical protein
MIDHCVGLMWKMENGNLTSDETDLLSDICIKTCCYMTRTLYTINKLFSITACVGVRACVRA